jgi:hypothetical protein
MVSFSDEQNEPSDSIRSKELVDQFSDYYKSFKEDLHHEVHYVY